MPDDPRRIYWDSNVPLSYLNDVQERIPTIEELFKQVRAGEIELLTSSISRVEVAFAASEKEDGGWTPKPSRPSKPSGHRAPPSKRLSSTT